MCVIVFAHTLCTYNIYLSAYTTDCTRDMHTESVLSLSAIFLPQISVSLELEGCPVNRAGWPVRKRLNTSRVDAGSAHVSNGTGGRIWALWWRTLRRNFKSALATHGTRACFKPYSNENARTTLRTRRASTSSVFRTSRSCR